MQVTEAGGGGVAARGRGDTQGRRSNQMKSKQFRKGEKVWYYPLGKSRPHYRRKATVLEVMVDAFGRKVYRVEPLRRTMFPTFVGDSVLEKVIRKRG